MSNSLRKLVGSALALSLAAATSPVVAQSLDGRAGAYFYCYPELSPSSCGYPYPMGPWTFGIGSGVEIGAIYPTSGPAGGYGSIDISGNNILVDFYSADRWTPANFNGWFISAPLGNVEGLWPSITGVTVNPATNMSGFSNSNISFGPQYITVNWQGLAFTPDTIVSLDISFENGSSVPEPATWAMLIAGFGIAGFALRRSNAFKAPPPANRLTHNEWKAAISLMSALGRKLPLGG